MRIRVLAASAAAVLCGLAPDASVAGGLYLSAFGTSDMGTASAGANATADDASAALLNPAGMPRLPDHQAAVGLAPGFTRTEFRQSGDTPVAGNDGGNQGGLVPIASSQYVHKLSDRIRLGLALFSFAGAALDPNDDWVGRNEVTEVSLGTYSLLPSVGVRLTDWLSVGGGPAVTYGTMDARVRAPLPLLGEPTLRIKDADDWAVAPIAGVLLELSPTLRIGAVYQGETKLDFSGDVDLARFGAGIDLDMDLPQAVRVSGFWQATEKLALLASGGWEDWSALDDVPVSFASVGGALPLHFHDTWYVAGGLEYEHVGWTWQAGGRYDSSPVRDKNRVALLPLDEIYTMGIGVKRNYSENLRIGVALNWASLGSASLDQPTVKGRYDTNDLFLFNVSFQLKKLPWSGMLSL